MSKYNFEFKKQIVLEYLHGNIGSTTLAKKYNIKSEKQVRQWIKCYNEFGLDGLKRSRKKNTYTFEFKLHMVELYLTSEGSYEELSLANGINNYSMLARWVNDFRIAGPDALKPKKKGHKKAMDLDKQSHIKRTTDKTPTNTTEEYVKELENQLLKLKIENAFLKELRRLRLEDEAKTRELQESSTASEENSN